MLDRLFAQIGNRLGSSSLGGIRQTLGALALASAVALPLTAGAETPTTLPSVKFERAPLISPSEAATAYNARGSDHGTSFANVTGFEGRPPEIVELARALKRNETDPSRIADLIFEHVRNTTKTEFAFGLRKGPLGSIIDKSGTPFDQAALMVELARQAGLSAQYRIGQIKLTAAAFQNWTGVSDIQAACRMLANGGIPAAFTGATGSPADCALSGSLGDVTLLHPWVEISIGGQWRAYDPSVKSMSVAAGRDIASGAGLGAGQAAAQAGSTVESGAQAGAAYIRNVKVEDLDLYLALRGGQLLNDLRANASAADLDQVMGEPKIVESYIVDPTWSRSPPTGYSVINTGIAITGDLPDPYRTKLRVKVEFSIFPTTPAPIERQLFVDEIYGRRLEIDTDFDNNMIDYNHHRVAIELDDIPLASWSRVCDAPANGCTPGFDGIVEIEVNHPYLASDWSYADEVIRKRADLTVPIAIVSGYGEVSPALGAKWAGERAQDEFLPSARGSYLCPDGKEYSCYPSYRASAGDQARQKLAASWLAQISKAFALQTRLGGAVGQHHHSIGIVAWRHDLNSRTDNTLVNGAPPIADWDIVDQMVSLDIDTAFSLTSKTNNAGVVRALSRSVALAAATLEGSVVQQAQDLPDGASTAERFAWANRPDEDPCSLGTARRYYNFATAAKTDRYGLTVVEGSSTGCVSGPPVAMVIASDTLKNQLLDAVNLYADGGYQSIVSPAEVFLGPGHRFGAEKRASCGGGQCGPLGYEQTRQRGGALVATRTDANGDVIEIAHAIVDRDGLTKGGAGKEVNKQGTFDPSRAADALKDRFVDRSAALGVDLKTGLAGYTSPTLLTVGSGAAPYGLDYQLTYKAGVPCIGETGPCLGPTSGGWVSNWDISFGVASSGGEALGETTPRAAAGSLTAFWVMQDIYASASLTEPQKDVYAALVADWWRRQMVSNVATFTRGAQGVQFVKLVDSTWFAPSSPTMTLFQNGGPAKVRDTCTVLPAATRRWDWQSSSFGVGNPGDDKIWFGGWAAKTPINNDPCAFYYGFKPMFWVWPKGPTLNFTTEAFGGRVTGVTTTLGRTATLSAVGTFEAAGLTARQTAVSPTADSVINAKGEITKVDFTGEVTRSATTRPVPFKRISQVYDPVAGTQGLAAAKPVLSYAYDTVGRVREARDGLAIAGARGVHAFYFADGARGDRIDPLGYRFTVYYDRDGDAVRHVDEIARITTSGYDGRHRVIERIYPGTDSDRFAYDDRGNVVELRKVAKSTASPKPGDLIVAAEWNPWNKPNWVRDAKGFVTDFVYYEAAGAGQGEIRQVTQPAVEGGRPTWLYEYNAKGLVSKTTDPLNVQTTFLYDDLGNLIQTVADATGLALRTCRAYDAAGKMISETEPRAPGCPQ
jgi:YD repeat-containing protein